MVSSSSAGRASKISIVRRRSLTRMHAPGIPIGTGQYGSAARTEPGTRKYRVLQGRLKVDAHKVFFGSRGRWDGHEFFFGSRGRWDGHEPFFGSRDLRVTPQGYSPWTSRCRGPVAHYRSEEH